MGESLVRPFYVMEILERAKELEQKGEKVIHFEVGEPDLPVPEKIKKAAVEAIEKTELKYTESLGIPKLREAIAGFYEREYGVKVPPERVVVTPGSSPGLLSALKVASRLGKIGYTDPGYPCYKNLIDLLNVEGVPVKVSAENGFKPKPEDINTEVFIVNSPANPTGTVYEKEELEELSKRAFLISDEIYHGLVYSGRAPSVLEVTGNAVVVNGFSKFFLMTGWRLGWLIVPDWFVPDVQAILQNAVISAPTVSQLAAVKCFDEDVLEELKENVETFKKRRDLMVKGLKEIGFKILHEPQGAFYVYADASSFSTDSLSFSLEVLEKTKVAITPGIDFGYNETNRFMRFSFCTSLKQIEEGLERLYRFLK
jgi:aspartate/methionine/tyrosine aminotransferase